MKEPIILVIALIISIELFILHNGGVLFLFIAFGLYMYSLKKEEKSYIGIAVVFFVLAIMSMVTLSWILPALIVYWLYVKYWQKETRPKLFASYATPEVPYAWRDESISKLIGHITIDTTKTILPLEPAFISVVQGIGKTIIYVPYDVACTIVVSQGFGKVSINGELTKEKRIHLEPDSRRKLMVHVTNGMGEVEIWQK